MVGLGVALLILAVVAVVLGLVFYGNGVGPAPTSLCAMRPPPDGASRASPGRISSRR